MDLGFGGFFSKVWTPLFTCFSDHFISFFATFLEAFLLIPQSVICVGEDDESKGSIVGLVGNSLKFYIWAFPWCSSIFKFKLEAISGHGGVLQYCASRRRQKEVILG